MNRLGITLPLDGEPLPALRETLDQVAGLGYTDVWSSEVASADAFMPLTMTAMTHPQFRLGTAIASAFIRSPALLTMNAASLASVSEQEVLVGIGASSDVMVSRWHGVPFERPYQRVRDVVRFVKQALGGERMSFRSDSFQIDGFRLGEVPARPPKVLVAALRQQMLKLAGREADGVILNWLGPADVRTVVPYVHEGNPDAEVVARLFVVVADDREVARAHARRLVTAYLNVGVYAEYHRWLGRADVLEPMWKAWAAGDRAAAVAAVPDALVDELFLTGTPAEIRHGIDEYRSAGVTCPVLAVMSAGAGSAREALGRLGRLTGVSEESVA
jgi:probable F420-dependent oxidoreductase